MAVAWTYSDWETGYTEGSSAQLARLRLHIKEVSDALLDVNVSFPGGRSISIPTTNRYLEMLRAKESDLATRVNAASGARGRWSRGIVIPE